MMVGIKKIIFLALVLLVVSMSACSTKYVCANGDVVSDAGDCSFVAQPVVVERKAEQVVDTYASAYARALSVTSSRVNTYRQEGHWFSVVLFTDTSSGEVNSVIFKIDGVTATVTCYEGCDYFSKQNVDEIGDVVGEGQTSTGEHEGPNFSIY